MQIYTGDGYIPPRYAAQADTFPWCAANNGPSGSGQRQQAALRCRYTNFIVGKPMKKKEQQGEEKGRKKRGKGSSISTIILVVILLAGVAILAYPSLSDWWNSMHATKAIAGYVTAVEELSAQDKEDIINAAREYNETLSNGVDFELTEEELAEYDDILDITGTGIMGYVQISSIGVNLPIYHSVEEEILQIAVGHIPGSSFPVGGERTHAVLSGHRGLPSAKLFSDLDKVVEGDIFTVNVLDSTITYMVDQIRIVLPEDVDELAIQAGRDYCTLVTCTPYGINSHRMLVRGKRIENVAGEVVVVAEAVRIPTYIVIPAVGIPLLFVTLAIMLIVSSAKGGGMNKKQILDELRKDNSANGVSEEKE